MNSCVWIFGILIKLKLKYFIVLLTSLKDIMKSGLQYFLPSDQTTSECFYKVQAVMLLVCLLACYKATVSGLLTDHLEWKNIPFATHTLTTF
jgi:hypothetical protein